jgi:multidrug efflux system outer membrane protein
MKKAIILLAVVLFGGCAVGPDYKRPAVDIPQSFRFEDKEAKDLANTAWWQQFNDPVLNELIRIALQENKDLKIAVARIGQFVGRYVTTRAAFSPQFYASGSGGMQRVTEAGLPKLGNVKGNPNDVWGVFLNGNWEIDIWGKIRRATEAARAGILSSEEGRRTVILSLVAAVASAYIDLRDADKEMEISIKTAEAYRESLRIFELRFKEGFSSSIEVNMIKAEYEQALSRISFYGKTIPQLEDALSILLGRNPGPIPRGKTLDELALPDVPAGLPSPGGTRPDRSQRADRRGQITLLSCDLSDGCFRVLQHRPFKTFQASCSGLELCRTSGSTDLYGRCHQGASEICRSATAGIGHPLSAGHPNRFWRSERLFDRPESDQGAARSDRSKNGGP